ncbi:vacuolar protein sorting-associated protein 8-like [Quillaja saponaria]|uniref:Vacuolar protein sorting-associated protein 8-like n=1 Tax=Quillaja saponaria TaxID=32244 RepID=A0AAD7PPT5_QUISA|nr:vacuolar protein sorting-associated protein 8-like [Quillaja saponaria]
MTNKLPRIKTTSMELDLDSFLDSHNSSDEDEDQRSDKDLRSVHPRTIDEILNDCDSSSSSSSPPSSPPNFHYSHRRTDLYVTRQGSHSPKDDVSISTSKPASQYTEAIKPTQFDENFVQSKPSSFTWVKPGDYSDDPFRRVSRQLPSFFSGVRSNAKPGEALAAAAAASRSMPTPHAAAIKSRRAGSGTLQKIVDSGELGSIVGDDSDISSNTDLSGVVLELSKSDEKLVEDDQQFDNLQSSAVCHIDETSRRDGTLDTEVDDAKASNADKDILSTSTLAPNASVEPLNDFSLKVEEDRNLDQNSATSSSDNIKDENEVSVSDESNTRTDTNSAIDNANDFNEKASPSFHGFDKGGKTEEVVRIEALGRQELDNGSSCLEDNQNEVAVSGEDDVSPISDINQLVAERLEQLETRRANKRAEKKSQSSKKPLELAEEIEKKYASTGFHWEEGAAALPMRLEGVRRGSTTLGYFDTDASNAITRTISSQAFKREHGSPQVLVVHANYIAVGMTKGLIVVVPSKYSPYHSDNMDAKVLMLGLQGDRLHASVTSMSFNQQGDLLLAGYGDGHVTFWDVQKTSVAKVISGEHTAPVVHTLFLGQDSQNTRQFKAVTGDSKGLVLLHSISVVPLLNRFSIKTQCLLDGQRTGTVLSASPLLFDEFCGSASLYSQGNSVVSTSSIGSMMGGVVGGDSGWKLFNEGSSLIEEGVVVFVTYQTVLVVRLTPKLEVYAQLSKPDGVREGSMPYTAWKCTTQSENTPVEVAERVSLLAIAWDRKVQVAKLVKSELKVYGKWSIDSAAIGLAWLDDQMLVVLTLTGQLYLFAKDGTVIHQTSFYLDGLGGDDLVSYHTHFINIFGNPEKAYHNSIAVRGASIYILGPMHLIASRLLPWKERIQVLRKAGDWMGALNMAMTLYDGQAHGVIDLPRTLDAVHEAIMPFLVELLLSYVEEVFSYISVAFCNQIGNGGNLDDSFSRSTSVHSQIKEQYTRVGGVAVEFCVHIKRTDILFDEIFSKFVDVQQRDTFLELLEPYILKDMLGSLPPEIMQALVEHYSTKGWLQRVEQCVLHMDISSLDFNQVIRLCREHGLYGALVYLFNKGLNDFRAPLEELLAVLRNSQKESATALGYRMLVYLKYCFSGLAFPPGHGTIHPAQLPSIRTELLQFLLENSDALNSQAVSSLKTAGPYLNLYHFLELDTEAALDVLRSAFVEDEIPNPSSSSHDSGNEDMGENKDNNNSTGTQNLLVQNTVDALIHILDKGISRTDITASVDDAGLVKDWPSKKDIGHLFEFIAYYVALQRANVSNNILRQMLEFLTSEDNVTPSVSVHGSAPKRREKQVLALLEVLPEADWQASYVLDLCEKAHFYQVCGLIHTIRHEYIAALDSYLKDVDEPIYAFSFINKSLLQLADNDRSSFRSAIISRIPQLIDLSREGTFLMVINHFSEQSSHILTELRSHSRSLFLYLKTLIEVHLSGTLNFSYLIRKDNVMYVPNGSQVKDQPQGLDIYLESISNFPKFLRDNPIHVTDDVIELYLELLCQYESNLVLKFLDTFDSYRVEHCLRLCQEYGIIDAAAFLLERVGDVGSALLLTLSGLNDKFMELDATVGVVVSNQPLSGSCAVEEFITVSKMKEVDDIRNLLHACIGLCQRNTPRLNPEESETHWFRLLDSFCEPLMNSCSDEVESKGEYCEGTIGSVNSQGNSDSGKIKWRILKYHKGAHVLRKLFSQFIKEIVEGMIGYVRLPTIMSKLLSDNGSQEFGDFKLTILGMLGTYGFERRILDTAKSLIEDDTFYTMNILKKGASHGYAPQSLVCCICSCPLTKNSSRASIRVFNCGHASHLHCEALENDSSSRGTSSGCPVCMPNKKSQRSRNKSVLAENGLVNNFSAGRQQPHGSTIYPHESDLAEIPYGHQQISRFEMLSKIQKDQKIIQIENLPHLRLAPPAVYHEKVNKVTSLLTGESSNNGAVIERPSKSRQHLELRIKGSSLRFPLKSSIFGKEKTIKH